MFGDLNSDGELWKSEVVCLFYSERGEWRNWLWFWKVSPAGERRMDWRWEDQMQASSSDGGQSSASGGRNGA